MEDRKKAAPGEADQERSREDLEQENAALREKVKELEIYIAVGMATSVQVIEEPTSTRKNWWLIAIELIGDICKVLCGLSLYHIFSRFP